jgi:hypothetical protein
MLKSKFKGKKGIVVCNFLFCFLDIAGSKAYASLSALKGTGQLLDQRKHKHKKSLDDENVYTLC